MTESEAPRIEFPCDYPIKVMGETCEEFREHVLTVMERHAPGFDQTKVSIRESRKSTFQAVTVIITATGKPQLEALFIDLKTSSRVRMVL